MEIGKWDPGVTKAVIGLLRPNVKRYYRSEVHGLQNIPRGGGLLVSNHSGGELPMDWQVFVVDFYDKFGHDWPIYSLAHDAIFHGPQSEFLLRLGIIHATADNAAKALAAGHLVLVFPGGDYDVYRPTRSASVIDFAGHKGYARTAIDAGVPIVPVGGHHHRNMRA